MAGWSRKQSVCANTQRPGNPPNRSEINLHFAGFFSTLLPCKSWDLIDKPSSLEVTERVLVTGIPGYIGWHCAAELHKQRYEVAGTIRSRAKAESTKAAITKMASNEKVSLVEAELLSDNGWAHAMNCRA